jgi:S-DNA-T family DNA segregation ATPase FtsK/SpoIIIE
VSGGQRDSIAIPDAENDLEDAEVIEGEIVPDDNPIPAPVHRQVVQVVTVVVTHDRTRAVVLHAAYPFLGGWSFGRRLWLSRTTARYEAALNKANAESSHEAALEWEKRLSQFRRDRHQRRKDMIGLPVMLIKEAPKIALGCVAVLATIGVLLAIATQNIREIETPFLVTADIVKIVAIVVSIAWGPLLLLAPWAVVAGLWWEGRNYARLSTAGWLSAARPDAELGVVVTADTITLALQHIGISELKRAFKEGWQPTFYTTPVRDGRGYSAVFSLPMGATPDMIADRRPVFARNVHRAEIEVWPVDAGRAEVGPPGSVSVWIADRGAVSRNAPEYPLLHEGQADVFEGVPGGVVVRGDPALIPVVGNNWVTGGMMGQGKSNACRVVMLGAALDPLAELWVHVFANNGDFDSYEPRLARYIKGAEDEQLKAAIASLQELYAEVGRRESRLADLNAKKVTRSLALAHPDLRPKIALFSECHELFGHAEHGSVAADLAVSVLRRARKTAISLGFDTQSSRKEAIPPKIVELVSVNACFYVKTWRSNDGFLGDGSFAAGIRATELRPGRDRGTSVITGVSDEQFELLRWYFVEVDDDTGYDAAAEVIRRAAEMTDARTPAVAPVPVIEDRDLLTDLDAVLGTERVRLADVPALLREHAPGWLPYRSLTGAKLRVLLDDEGVRVTKTGGIYRLEPADLREVIASGPGGEP